MSRMSKAFDCVEGMRQTRDRLSADIADKGYADLVRWLRSHRYADPFLQRLAEDAGQRGAAASDGQNPVVAERPSR